jgi:SAM-dependent methyltransferase
LLLPINRSIEQLLIYLLLVAVLLYTLNQVRRPTKWVGRFFLWIMNMSHSSVTDWGLKHVEIEEHFTILDVGCGGGRTIEKLAALARRGMVLKLVTAVETQYYWPDLVKDMQEILRVLKPGGTLIVIAESYKKRAYDRRQRPVMKPLRSTNLGVNEHRELFSTAGFTDIQIFEERTKGWICGIGKKPV